MFNHPHYGQTRPYMHDRILLSHLFSLVRKFNDGVNHQSWSVSFSMNYVLAKVNHSPEVGANIPQKDWNQQL